MMNNKRKMTLLIIISLVFIGIVGAVTYSLFNYTRTGANNELVLGEIYFHYNTNTLSLEKMIPSSTYDENNYVTFTIDGKNTYKEKDIIYGIELLYGDEISGKTRIKDRFLRFTLLEKKDDGEWETVLDNEMFNDLNNKRIYVDTIPKNGNQETVHEYKLYYWISDTINVGNSPYADYSMEEWNNLYATFKIKVTGDFQEKEVVLEDTAYKTIKTMSSTNSNVVKKLASNIEHQDSYQSEGTEDIYYFTGSEAKEKGNVLFGGYCWQIVRTTDTGGVKLLYNGEPEQKKIYSGEPITLSDSDITYTNDTAYPYSYDSTNKTWTNTNSVSTYEESVKNTNNTTSNFTFKVKESGNYFIHYDVSSQDGYDIVRFYLNNDEIGSDSGIIESEIRLGDLSSSDTIKVSYIKNGNVIVGRDNVIFSIKKNNGEVSETIKSCDNGRIGSLGINGVQGVENLTNGITNGVYDYSDKFTYNLDTKKFTLSGNVVKGLKWNDSTYKFLIGKYTCKNQGTNSSNSTCDTLYYVQDYDSSTTAVISKYIIKHNTHYSVLSVSDFNGNSKSLASVGYMYNNSYPYKTNTTLRETLLSTYNLTNMKQAYFGDGSWNSSTNRYNLSNTFLISGSNYHSIKGKYTFNNTNSDHVSTAINYITAVEGTTGYFITLKNSGNHTLEEFDTAYTYGTTITEENGKYRISNGASSATVKHKTDWYDIRNDVQNKYLCMGDSDLCEIGGLRYVTYVGQNYYNFIPVTNYRFGSDVIYQNGKYTLSGTTQDVFDWTNTYNSNANIIQNTHYTCFNENGSNECGDKVYFVFYTTNTALHYIELMNGKKVENALHEQLNYKDANITDDANINKYNSSIKGVIDNWYENNLITEKNSLDDTVFCNERTILNNNNWNQNGSTSYGTTLAFYAFNTLLRNKLKCEREVDKFSLKNSKAKLTYPIGLLIEGERNLIGNAYARINQGWWLLSPYGFYSQVADVAGVSTSGNFSGMFGGYVSYLKGLRPSVSLKPGTVFTGGNGSYDEPFVVGDMN